MANLVEFTADFVELTIGFVELTDFVALTAAVDLTTDLVGLLANLVEFTTDLVGLIIGFVALVTDFVGLTTAVDLTTDFVGLATSLVELPVDLDSTLLATFDQLLADFIGCSFTDFVELEDFRRLASTAANVLAGTLVEFTAASIGLTMGFV
jgi:hypothetical protein